MVRVLEYDFEPPWWGNPVLNALVSAGLVGAGAYASGARKPEELAASTIIPALAVGGGTHLLTKGKVFDKSGYGNHGTIYGASWVDGRLGKALSFDGVDDYVEVPHSESLNPNFFTIEAWIYGDVFAEKEPMIAQKGATFAYPGYAVGILNSRVRFNIGRTEGESILDSQAVLETGKWYHIVVVYDGTQKIYINGVRDPAETSPPYYEKSTEPLWIGWTKRMQTPSFAWDGIIDEVRIYNRALTDEEIFENYYRSARAASR